MRNVDHLLTKKIWTRAALCGSTTKGLISSIMRANRPSLRLRSASAASIGSNESIDVLEKTHNAKCWRISTSYCEMTAFTSALLTDLLFHSIGCVCLALTQVLLFDFTEVFNSSVAFRFHLAFSVYTNTITGLQAGYVSFFTFYANGGVANGGRSSKCIISFLQQGEQVCHGFAHGGSAISADYDALLSTPCMSRVTGHSLASLIYWVGVDV